MALNEEARRRTLQAEIKRARTAVSPKRARFAREIDVNDTTLQIAEGAKVGPISDDMLDYITGKLGWPHGRWREILQRGLSEVEVVITESPSDVIPALLAVREGGSAKIDTTHANPRLRSAVRWLALGFGSAINADVQTDAPGLIRMSAAAPTSTGLSADELKRQLDAEDPPALTLAAQRGDVEVPAAVADLDTAGEEDQS